MLRCRLNDNKADFHVSVRHGLVANAPLSSPPYLERQFIGVWAFVAAVVGNGVVDLCHAARRVLPVGRPLVYEVGATHLSVTVVSLTVAR